MARSSSTSISDRLEVEATEARPSSRHFDMHGRLTPFGAPAAWRPMAEGVAFLMRPPTAVDFHAAEEATLLRVRAARAGAAVYAEAGFGPPTPEQLADKFWHQGVTRWLLAVELAARIVEDWRGVIDPTSGEAAPMTPVALAEVLANDKLRPSARRDLQSKLPRACAAAALRKAAGVRRCKSRARRAKFVTAAINHRAAAD